MSRTGLRLRLIVTHNIIRAHSVIVSHPGVDDAG